LAAWTENGIQINVGNTSLGVDIFLFLTTLFPIDNVSAIGSTYQSFPAVSYNINNESKTTANFLYPATAQDIDNESIIGWNKDDVNITALRATLLAEEFPRTAGSFAVNSKRAILYAYEILEDTTGTFQKPAKVAFLSLIPGGIFEISARKTVTDFQGSSKLIDKFINPAKRATLSLIGLEGTLGSFQISSIKGVLNLSGYSNSVGDFVNFAVRPRLTLKELIEIYDCVVINLTNRAVSKYTNYNFNSISKYGDIVLLASDNGIYIVDGNTDNATNISSYIKTVRDDFGSKNLKNIPDAFIGISGGAMKIQTYQDNTAGTIQTLDSTGTNIRNRRVKLSLNNLNRYWSIKLSNSNGSDFKIDSISLPVDISKRSTNE